MSLPAAVQPLRCNNPDCGLPSGGRCALSNTFETPLEQCTELVRVAASEAADPGEDDLAASSPPAPRVEAEGLEEDSDPAPWSGRHLGRAEALQFMGTRPCRVVAVVGPYDSGKTCLLTSFFLQIANGRAQDLPYAFAGSRSLLGFHTLVQQVSRYKGTPAEQALDHTVTEESEHANSFLHLAFRPHQRDDHRVIDLLLSDVPGEWFTALANHDDAQARRRLPFLERCDGFIVLADSNTLLSDAGGALDQTTSLVLRRLDSMMHSWKRRAPVVLALSKYDRVWPEVGDPPAPASALDRASWGPLGRRLRRTLNMINTMSKRGTSAQVVAVSAIPRPLAQGQPVGVVDPFAWIMQQTDQRAHHERLLQPVPANARPFAAMRREALP